MPLLDHLTLLRQRVEARPPRRRGLLTLMAGLLVAGGLVRLALDDHRAEIALPEPPFPAERPAPLPIAAALHRAR